MFAIVKELFYIVLLSIGLTVILDVLCVYVLKSIHSTFRFSAGSILTLLCGTLSTLIFAGILFGAVRVKHQLNQVTTLIEATAQMGSSLQSPPQELKTSQDKEYPLLSSYIDANKVNQTLSSAQQTTASYSQPIRRKLNATIWKMILVVLCIQIAQNAFLWRLANKQANQAMQMKHYLSEYENY